MRHMIKSLAGSGVGLAMLVTFCGVAMAHVDSDPIAVQAGTTATVSFHVEHGCNGSPTTALDFQIPAGVTNVKAVDKSGWTSKVDASTIQFTGGPLDATAPDSFSITFTAPTAPGTVYFKLIQTCTTGENDWIEIPVAGRPEPELPAPAISITAGPPTSAELVPPADAPAASTLSPSPATPTTSAAGRTSSSDSSHTGLIVAIVAGVLVVAGAVTFAVKRSRSSTTSRPEPR